MMEFPFLLGDLDDWVRIIIILIFILGPILNAVGGARGKKPAGGPMGRPLPPGPPGRGDLPPRQLPAGQAQPGKGRQALENEIEEFLRRTGRGGERQPPARPAEQPQPQPIRRLTEQARPPQAKPQPAKPQPAKPRQAQRLAQQQQPPAKPRQRRPLGEGVGRHVKEHIEAHPVSEHSRELGRRVAQADEKVEDHLQQVFDHRLGGLEKEDIFGHSDEGTDSSVWTKKVTVSPAVELRKMLRDPGSIRNAIILAEVFKRPQGLE